MKVSSLLTMAALLAAGSWTASAQNQLPVNFLGLTALEVGPQGLSGGPDDDLFTLNHHARTPNANGEGGEYPGNGNELLLLVHSPNHYPERKCISPVCQPLAAAPRSSRKR